MIFDWRISGCLCRIDGELLECPELSFRYKHRPGLCLKTYSHQQRYLQQLQLLRQKCQMISWSQCILAETLGVRQTTGFYHRDCSRRSSVKRMVRDPGEWMNIEHVKRFEIWFGSWFFEMSLTLEKPLFWYQVDRAQLKQSCCFFPQPIFNKLISCYKLIMYVRLHSCVVLLCLVRLSTTPTPCNIQGMRQMSQLSKLMNLAKTRHQGRSTRNSMRGSDRAMAEAWLA